MALLSVDNRTTNLPAPTQALAHSLDEHKRLVAAKQNQELLLANHFKSINLGEPTGQNDDVLIFC